VIFIVRATSQANATARALRLEVNAFSQQEQELRQKAAAVQQSLTPEQYQTLRATHELVDRKSFSWSRLFADLEAALPPNIKVTRISVREVTSKEGQTLAELDLAVLAKAPATVTTMIADMHKEGIFKGEMRSQNLQKGRGESGTEFELFVVYSPRASVPASDKETAALAASHPAGGAK